MRGVSRTIILAIGAAFGACAAADMGCYGDCVDLFDKCGGSDLNDTLPCCTPGAQCVAKSSYFASCLMPTRAESNFGEGWDARVIGCGTQALREVTMYDAEPPRACNDSMVWTGQCVDVWGTCADAGSGESLPCCAPGYACVVKNADYAQCIPEDRMETNVGLGWEGSVLECEMIG